MIVKTMADQGDYNSFGKKPQIQNVLSCRRRRTADRGPCDSLALYCAQGKLLTKEERKG